MPKKKAKLESLETQVDIFNARYPIGTEVNVKKDDGEVFKTKTRSEAWVLSGHTPLIMLEGIRGGYLLDRVTAI